MFTSPGAIAFKLGFFEIRWYGLLISLGFLCGLKVSLLIAKQLYKTDKTISNNLFDFASVTLIGAVIGARLYYGLLSLDYFISHPLEILMIWTGGLSIHGGLLGGVIAGWIYTKINKLSFLKYADLTAFGLIIGQSIGRWGNFFNSEAFGRPTDLPWKLFIPAINRPNEYLNYEYFHPTFLYESLWNLAVFFILYFLIKDKFYKYRGFIFFSYLTLYSIGRIIIESVRIDSVYNFSGIPIAQLVSFVLILIGGIGVSISYKLSRPLKNSANSAS